MLRWIGVGFACLVVFGLVAVHFFAEDYPFALLNPGPQNNTTPGALGLSYERLVIPSGPRRLDAFYVPAPQTCRRQAAVLIYHGRGETLASWIAVQKLLHDHCIASLVFDYTGHGRSSPGGSIRHLNEDASAAYVAFVGKTQGQRRCTLSFSMGAGPMLAAALAFSPPPDCVVVASAFTSLKGLGAKAGAPSWLMLLAPDSWNNSRAIARLHVPVMILHSRADKADPYWMGEALYAAANEPKVLVPLDGFRHDAAHEHPSGGWWSPAIAFILG